MKNLICILVLLFSSVSAFGQSPTLELYLSGVEAKNGSYYIALYDTKKSFNDPDKAYVKFVKPVETKMPIKIENLEPGNYAIAIFFDTNRNDIIDRNFLGIPTEKYGFSNNARRTFSAPTFDEASFQFPANSSLKITLQ